MISWAEIQASRPRNRCNKDSVHFDIRLGQLGAIIPHLPSGKGIKVIPIRSSYARVPGIKQCQGEIGDKPPTSRLGIGVEMHPGSVLHRIHWDP